MHRNVPSLKKQTDMSERQIQRWWRLRRAGDRPTTLVKFCENTWRCIYYTYSFIFGIIVLWDKPWFWDIKHCWYGYPHQAAKLTKYAKYQKLCDFIFAVFTIVWIVTRLGFYPRIIYSSSVEAPQILPMFPAYYIFNTLLILLLLLHIVWTYLILQIVVDSLQKGLMSGDIRSSDSDDVSDSSESALILPNGNHGEQTKKSKDCI
ncbi:PREDICTED: ceramide synthase 6 isoform X2 [Rhagoletis zephyria]|uniref:ceramide synthase 6 isoform X2 n=1 Tax=Rhagoletis zephyria TaxID=28612 RepID=UPI000811A4A8|nr:PREDICTED: ceramide synthase 6 isoform X2 [Rhagoletis zephyria]